MILRLSLFLIRGFADQHQLLIDVGGFEFYQLAAAHAGNRGPTKQVL